MKIQGEGKKGFFLSCEKKCKKKNYFWLQVAELEIWKKGIIEASIKYFQLNSPVITHTTRS